MSDVVVAHKHSSGHRQEIESSSTCGCFYCLAMFPPSSISDWCDEETTALCPQCGVDSVIGDASGFPVGDDLLQRMKRHWFW